ncbi:MAG: DUF2226 domain-containing protein [Archaeoglobaceae archaeon]
MILPKISATRIDRGKFASIVENLLNSKFTGFVKVAFRKDELSIAEILFENGKAIAAEVTKVKSKRSLSGDSAIAEIRDLENVVVEVYALAPGEVKKIFEMNRSFEVKETFPIRPAEPPPKTDVKAKSEKEAILEKYNISLPQENEIESLIENAIGNSEFYVEIEKQKILDKYGIKKPRDEEIEQIIANALGEETEEVEVGVEKDFETVKSEIIKILETRLGKPAKKAIDIVNSCKSMSELSQNAEEIGKALKALVVFIPRKKVEEVIAEIEQKIGRRLG